MKPEIQMIKPVVYQSRKTCLNCIEYLIASIISTYGFEYHWIFSNSWGVYYKKENEFGDWLEPYPSILNLNEIYDMSSKQLPPADLLLTLLQQVDQQEEYLLLFLDSFDMPYHPNYQNINSVHAVLITGLNILSNEVHIVDWLPEFSGWLSIDILNSSWIQRGKRYLLYSKPRFIYSNRLLEEKLTSCHTQIVGSVTSDLSTGIFALERMKTDLISSFGTNFPFDIWWDQSFHIINTRNTFLEFTCFLQESNLIERELLQPLISSIDQTVHAWMLFRNSLMRSKMINDIEAAKHIQRFDKIIQLERQCGDQLELILTQLKKAVDVHE